MGFRIQKQDTVEPGPNPTMLVRADKGKTLNAISCTSASKYLSVWSWPQDIDKFSDIYQIANDYWVDVATGGNSNREHQAWSGLVYSVAQCAGACLVHAVWMPASSISKATLCTR